MVYPFFVGQRFGRLVVVELLGTIRKKRRALCRCDCGAEKLAAESDLRTGTVTSCGCARRERAADLNRTHGQSGKNRTYLYRTWEALWDRVNRRPEYAARGASDTFATFEAFRDYVERDLGARPPGATLDRIDNDRGYEPGNLRWSSATTQARNRSSNVHITVDGVTRTIAEWAEVTGISQQVIYQRRKRGMPDHLAVTLPAKPYKKGD